MCQVVEIHNKYPYWFAIPIPIPCKAVNPNCFFAGTEETEGLQHDQCLETTLPDQV